MLGASTQPVSRGWEPQACSVWRRGGIE